MEALRLAAMFAIYLALAVILGRFLLADIRRMLDEAKRGSPDA